jgi:hypothetical protein
MVRVLRKGANDLQTLFPQVAEEAYGWDPSEILSAVKDKKTWICHRGHIWTATVNHRTSSKTGCPYCSNKRPIIGENDLQTLFPDIAAQADGWNPSELLPKSNKRVKWKCEFGHTWTTSAYMRTDRGTNCPFCNNAGYNRSKDGWMYLLTKKYEQKIGITNNLKARFRTHRRNKWLVADVIGPLDGERIWLMEKHIKGWLRKSDFLMPGTAENWGKKKLIVANLNEIFALSSIDHSLVEGVR